MLLTIILLQRKAKPLVLKRFYYTSKTLSIIVSLFCTVGAFSQTAKDKLCYQETIDNKVSVFTNALYSPNYKGREEALNVFLLSQVDVQAIANSISETVNFFSDSVKVKFIIARTGQMSDLSVEGNNAVLSSEIRKALIKSACNWIPGGTEMYLPAWYTGTIHFALKRQREACSIMISVIPANPTRR